MANHGGKRQNAGRKAKADEIKIAETMDNILNSEDVVLKLSALVKEGNYKAIELWLNYRFGKPQQSIDHTTNGNDVQPPISWS